MKSQKYVCGSRKCDLCICEKLLIARADLNVLLKPSDNWRHETQCHGYLLLLITLLDAAVDDLQTRPLRQILLFLRNNSLTV